MSAAFQGPDAVVVSDEVGRVQFPERSQGKAKSEQVPKAPPSAYIVRMRPALAAQIVNRAFVRIPWPVRAGDGAPLTLKTGDRIFLIEFAGGTTGRADLVSVEGFINAKGFPAGYPEAPGHVWVRRGYCTHRAAPGVSDGDYLSAVGYQAVLTGCAVLDAVPEPAPAAPAPGVHVTAMPCNGGDTGPCPVHGAQC